MNKSVLGAALAAGILVSGAADAALVTYGFACIGATGNTTTCVAGQTQLRLDVTDTDSNGTLTGQALFIFRNIGNQASSITDVYFDDGTLLSIAQVVNSTGVNFSQFATPRNLPGGNNLNPSFNTTAGFSADSVSPVSINGVNPGEQVSILFNLLSGQTFSNVLDALNGTLTHSGGEPALRVGVHVQAFADGTSASFVNSTVPLAAVPLPAAAWLMLSGLGALSLIKRRRKA